MNARQLRAAKSNVKWKVKAKSMRAWGWPGLPRPRWAGAGVAVRERRGQGREHAIVDRLVSVVFRFEFEGLAGQSESDPMIVRSESDPTIVRSDVTSIRRNVRAMLFN